MTMVAANVAPSPQAAAAKPRGGETVARGGGFAETLKKLGTDKQEQPSGELADAEVARLEKPEPESIEPSLQPIDELSAQPLESNPQSVAATEDGTEQEQPAPDAIAAAIAFQLPSQPQQVPTTTTAQPEASAGAADDGAQAAETATTPQPGDDAPAADARLRQPATAATATSQPSTPKQQSPTPATPIGASQPAAAIRADAAEPAVPSKETPQPATTAANPATPAQPAEGRRAALDMLMGLTAPQPREPGRTDQSARRTERPVQAGHPADAQPLRAENVTVDAVTQVPVGEPVSRMRAAVSEFALRFGARGERQPAAEAMPGATPTTTGAPALNAPSAAPAQGSATGQQLAADIAASLSARSAAAEAGFARDAIQATRFESAQSLRLQLQPIELGTVTVDLTANGERMDVEIRVETEEARQRLSSDTDDIVRTLRGLGFEIDRVQLAFNNPQPAGQQQSDGRSGNAMQQPQQDGSARGEGERSQTRQGSGEFQSARGDGDARDGGPGTRGLYI